MLSKTIGKDLGASLVVFLVALPLCMGVALASGGNVIQGILAGVIGGVIVGAISGSHVSVSGPAAGLITIIESSFESLKELNAEHYLEAFALAVVLSGLIQLILGVIKMGVIADFIPVSVIKGMLAAIGIIMILKQVPHLVGYDKDEFGEEEFLQHDGHNTFSELFFSIEQFTILAIIIGLIGLVLHFLWDNPKFKAYKITQVIPASLITVILGISINELALKFSPEYAIKPEHMVSVPVLSDSVNIGKSLHGLYQQFNFPDFHFIQSIVVWKIAILLAIVASIESLLSLEAGDKIDTQKRTSPANRELIAQGIGNVVGGFVGALPITAVIVRTSANVNAGAKTKSSTIFHGIWLLVFVLFAPKLINRIPLSALASILIYVGYKLAKPILFIEQFKKGKNAFYPFLVTIIAILFSDLLIGISIGLLLGFYFVIKSNFHKSFNLEREDNNVLIRFHHQASFLNKSILKRKLATIKPNEFVVLDFINCTFMDPDILEILTNFMAHAELNKISVEMSFASDSQETNILKSIKLPLNYGR